MRPLSRLLVLLTTMLLLVMPVTEHLCNWDQFLRGGPDVEFSLLAWLLFAAMVVLSMNGTMLRPVTMQPAVPVSVSVSRTASEGSGAASGSLPQNFTSQFVASSRSRHRCWNEPAPATDAGRISHPDADLILFRLMK
jgi:hypothetical protein